MIKSPLRKFATALCISAIGLSTCAEAKWSISNHTNSTVNTRKVQAYFVQIFSSINATKAEGIKNTLEINGYPAFIKIKTKPNKSCYQVQIGPFSSKRLASTAKASIVQRYPKFSFLNDAILTTAFQY